MSVGRAKCIRGGRAAEVDCDAVVPGDILCLEEGDRVTVTYTGTLDNEDPSPVAVAVSETEG